MVLFKKVAFYCTYVNVNVGVDIDTSVSMRKLYTAAYRPEPAARPRISRSIHELEHALMTPVSAALDRLNFTEIEFVVTDGGPVPTDA